MLDWFPHTTTSSSAGSEWRVRSIRCVKTERSILILLPHGTPKSDKRPLGESIAIIIFRPCFSRALSGGKNTIRKREKGQDQSRTWNETGRGMDGILRKATSVVSPTRTANERPKNAKLRNKAIVSDGNRSGVLPCWPYSP